LGYTVKVIEVRTTAVFDAWLAGLRDRSARARIRWRIDRLSLGNPGQHRILASGLRELKIDHGPGYRVYYIGRGGALVMLLCGGDKRTQQKDIDLASKLKKMLEES
jgi:putative addiction module killer protein